MLEIWATQWPAFLSTQPASLLYPCHPLLQSTADIQGIGFHLWRKKSLGIFHPWKLRWHWKSPFSIGNTSSNGGFSIVNVSFRRGGVSCMCFEILKHVFQVRQIWMKYFAYLDIQFSFRRKKYKQINKQIEQNKRKQSKTKQNKHSILIYCISEHGTCSTIVAWLFCAEPLLQRSTSLSQNVHEVWSRWYPANTTTRNQKFTDLLITITYQNAKGRFLLEQIGSSVSLKVEKFHAHNICNVGPKGSLSQNPHCKVCWFCSNKGLK